MNDGKPDVEGCVVVFLLIIMGVAWGVYCESELYAKWAHDAQIQKQELLQKGGK